MGIFVTDSFSWVNDESRAALMDDGINGTGTSIKVDCNLSAYSEADADVAMLLWDYMRCSSDYDLTPLLLSDHKNDLQVPLLGLVPGALGDGRVLQPSTVHA